jgi:hypothetical protein
VEALNCQVCGKSFETNIALAKHLEVAGRNSRPHREYPKRLWFDSGDILPGVYLERLKEVLGEFKA